MKRFAALLLALAALAGAFALAMRVVEVRADIADFLPEPATPEAAFLLQELRSGAATTLLLAGIEGAPPADLARVSQSVARAMAE